MARTKQTARLEGRAAEAREERKKLAIEQRKELKKPLNAFVDGEEEGPPLCTAATKGNVGLVNALLNELGADKNFKDKLGDTPLINAAVEGHLPVVEILLDAGADINLTGAGEGTALHGAAFEGYDEIADALLKKGAEKDARDDTGGTPLMNASHFGHLAVAKTLLAARADINIADDGGITALMGAAQEGHDGIVDALLDKGAEKNASDNNSNTPLILATYNGHLPVVKTLLVAHAAVNITDDQGNTAFHHAAREGHDAMVRALLRAEAGINSIGSEGATALIKAAYAGHLPVVETLLAQDADVNIVADNGITALISAAIGEHWPVVEILLGAGADPTARCSGKCRPDSALDLAAQNGQVRIMEALLQRGVDVNEEDEFCCTALSKAVGKDQAGAIDVLIKAGATTERKGLRHIFWSACRQTKCKAMLALLQHGADTSFASSGSTALHQVCLDSDENAEEAVSLLLRWGADETALDEAGKIPADLLNPNRDSVLGEPLSQDGVERVRLLLARAPADRVWRRRSSIVMIRARTLKAREVAGGDGGDAETRQVRHRGSSDEGQGFDMVVVVASLGEELEGVFRNIVSFL